MRRGQVATMFSKKRAEPIQLPPTPYVLIPSTQFEGNDGRWSTFFINVGDDGKNSSNGQNFRVLISTSSPATLVPQQTEWCSEPSPEECAASRGILSYEGSQSLGFDDTKSPQWKNAGIYNIPVPEWYNDTLQAEEPAAVWGVDNVGLGQSTPQSFILAEQYVVKYTVANFYMGSFGLAVGSTGPPGALKPNFMDNMYGSAHGIASRSYGYTAGAYYRNNNNGVTGSLVLGGYDKSRLSEQGVSISMPGRQNNTLAVGVNSILWRPDQDAEANTVSFTNRGFPATIDSTLPYLILPDDVCDLFVDKFGLTLDEEVQLYTVNDSSRQQNLRLNPTVSFKISASADTDSTAFADIVLPYSALDQEGGYPLFFNTTRYLPIKRSQNGRFVLGRTFLQEAYIVVDYERQNFTVAPATFSDPMPNPSLVTIFDRSYTGLPTPPESGSGGGLSSGAIAGIVVGIVGAFIIVAIGAYLLWRKKRWTAKEPEENTEKPSEIDTTFAGTEIKYRRVSELTGSEAPHSPKDPAAGYYSVDHKSYPPISEMSPESTPAELYSPPPDGRNSPDYFSNGRYSVPLAELPGGDTISSMPSKSSDMKPVQKPPHSRSPSDNSLSTNIDEVLAKKAPEAGPDSEATRSSVDPGAPVTAEEITKAKAGAQPEADNDAEEAAIERRPSHTRGLSDTTIQSDSTAVSQPTPEELERWARSVDGQSRPMSPS